MNEVKSPSKKQYCEKNTFQGDDCDCYFCHSDLLDEREDIAEMDFEEWTEEELKEIDKIEKEIEKKERYKKHVWY